MARWPQQTNIWIPMAAYVDRRSEECVLCKEENVTVALTLVF